MNVFLCVRVVFFKSFWTDELTELKHASVEAYSYGNYVINLEVVL